MTAPKSKLRKAVEVLVWIAALAVLAENIALFRQNQRLLEAAAPQIAAGTHLQMLSGLALDGRVEPVSLPPGSSNNKMGLLGGTDGSGEARSISDAEALHEGFSSPFRSGRN